MKNLIAAALAATLGIACSSNDLPKYAQLGKPRFLAITADDGSGHPEVSTTNLPATISAQAYFTALDAGVAR